MLGIEIKVVVLESKSTLQKEFLFIREEGEKKYISGKTPK